jgi:hypothetical protein
MNQVLQLYMEQILPENFAITVPGAGRLLLRDMAVGRGKGFTVTITDETAYNEALVELDDFAAELARHAEKRLADIAHPVHRLLRQANDIQARKYTRRYADLSFGGPELADGWWLSLRQRKKGEFSAERFADVLLCLILSLFPYDVAAEEEGAPKQQLLTKYERSRINRSLCLAFHGYDCKACGISLRDKYGDVARSYIHVHHLNPIAAAGTMTPDPINDMVPLCPNCHGVAHLRNPPYTPEEINKMIKR